MSEGDTKRLFVVTFFRLNKQAPWRSCRFQYTLQAESESDALDKVTDDYAKTHGKQDLRRFTSREVCELTPAEVAAHEKGDEIEDKGPRIPDPPERVKKRQERERQAHADAISPEGMMKSARKWMHACMLADMIGEDDLEFGLEEGHITEQEAAAIRTEQRRLRRIRWRHVQELYEHSQDTDFALPRYFEDFFAMGYFMGWAHERDESEEGGAR